MPERTSKIHANEVNKDFIDNIIHQEKDGILVIVGIGNNRSRASGRIKYPEGCFESEDQFRDFLSESGIPTYKLKPEDEIKYPGYLSVAKSRIREITKVMMESFGSLHVLMPYKPAEECYSSCDQAESSHHNCACPCFGEFHGKSKGHKSSYVYRARNLGPVNQETNFGTGHVHLGLDNDKKGTIRPWKFTQNRRNYEV